LSSLCLRRRGWQCAIVFFCDGVAKKKKMITHCHCLLLWCYWNKEGDDNKLPSPSSLCLRRRRRRGQHGNAPLSSFMVMF
jgi:hypothetical protein